MKEIEAKVLEIDRAALEARLTAIGAVLEFTAPFRAVYYDTPDTALRGRGDVLRLRQEGEEVAMTFKRRLPSEDAGVKVREELEVKVSDYTTACRILEGLGYQPGLVMNKVRTQYAIGGAHLVIDRYVDDFAHIPEFVEIEAPSLELLHAVAAQVGFRPAQLLSWSASELIAHYAPLKESFDARIAAMLDNIAQLTGPLGPSVSLAEREQAEVRWLARLQVSDIPALVALLRMPVDTLITQCANAEEVQEVAASGLTFLGVHDPEACLQAFSDLVPAAMTNATLVDAMGRWRQPGLRRLYEQLLAGTEDTAVAIALASAFSELPEVEAVPLLERLEARFGHDAEVAAEIRTARSILEINAI